MTVTPTGLSVFALALLGLAFFAHRRDLDWLGLIIGTIGGLVVAVSALGSWFNSRGGWMPLAGVVLLGGALIALIASLRDKSPDYVSSAAVFMIPTMLALSITAIPVIGSSASEGWAGFMNHMSTAMSNIG